MGFVTSKKNSLKTSRKKLMMIFVTAATFFIAAVSMVVVDPLIIIAKYKTRLTVGSPVHELLKTEVDFVHVSAYLFNITNPERFLAGEDLKLKIQEVGPFTYKEMRTHEDLELDVNAGVLRYSPHVTPVFVPEESIADPHDIHVIAPNIALLSMTSMMSSYPFINRVGWNVVVSQLKSKPIVQMDAHNYLWGYKEPLITVGNTFMPSWISFDTMGLMDRLYDTTVQYRLEVGATSADKFSVRSVNGHKGLTQWSYEKPNRRTKCNTFHNTYEGIGYPGELSPETPVRIFRNVLCRMLELDFYEKRTVVHGAKALVYKISNRTYTNNSDKECLCGRGICIEGLSDLSPCFYGLPFAMSNAHFLGADPELLQRIEGLSPNEEQHGSQFLIEPKIGMALGTAFSVQVNIVMNDVSYNAETTRFSEMVVPIGYFKIVQPELLEEGKEVLRQLYIVGPYFFLGVKILLFLISLSILAYMMRLLYWNWICSEGRGIDFQLPEEGKKSLVFGAEVPAKDYEKEYFCVL